MSQLSGRRPYGKISTLERACYLIGGFLIAIGVVHLAILTVGGGAWNGPVSLRKPATFGLSFGLTLVTLTWVASFLDMSKRWRRFWLLAFAIACVLEVVLISVQAWRGVPSHFNLETTLSSIIARTLAVGGAVLVAVIVAWTVYAFRSHSASASILFSVRSGALGLAFAALVGAAMIAIGMVTVFGGDQKGAYEVALEFKPAHAVTMHAILVLPLLAWVLSLLDWPEDRRLFFVRIAAAVYFTLSALILGLAFTGLDLTRAPWSLILPFVPAVVVVALTLVVARPLVSSRRRRAGTSSA